MKRITELFHGNGRVAVVIGGTGELCGQMAKVLGESGYIVVVAGRSEQKGKVCAQEICDKGGTAMFIPVDVEDYSSIQALLEKAVEACGRVDVVINGAGRNKGVDSILDFEPSDWDIMNTNARSIFWGIKVFGQHMKDNGGGNIINVSSVSTPKPLSRVSLYGASKAAVDHLTISAANDLGQHGIRVNAVRPGFFPAEQNASVLTAERKADIARQTPVKRDVYDDCTGFAAPQDLDAAVLYLASPTASIHTNGEIITVDGGFSGRTM